MKHLLRVAGALAVLGLPLGAFVYLIVNGHPLAAIVPALVVLSVDLKIS